MRGRFPIFRAALLLFTGCAAATAGASESAPASAPASAIESFELPASALIRAADQALTGQRLVEAKDLLDRLEDDPAVAGDSHVRLLRAEWLIASGRPADAWSRLVAIEGTNALECRVASAKAIALLQLDEADRAEQLFTDHRIVCDDYPVFWRSLGRLHLARGRVSAAIDALNAAAALEPANDAVQGDLAVALIAAGKAADAVSILSPLVERQPGATILRLNLDYARAMLGQRPARSRLDDDMSWSRRLQSAGLGAQRAERPVLAEALLGLALMVRPQHDEQLWKQYAAATGRDERGRR